MLLQIKDLHVESEGNKILNGINLNLNLGKINVLMGPNGSGKSTLAHVLMGDPKYKITKGKILFQNKDITKLKVHERARKGLFLSFQNPVEIEGIKVITLLHQAYNILKEENTYLLEFRNNIREKAELLGIKEEFLEREMNKGFSGGEKKKLELLQLLTLDPKLAILDETDSGLDINALKVVAKSINNFMNKGKCIFLITHYPRILKHIKPDKVFIIKEGKIVKSGTASLVKEIEKKGF